MGKRKFKKGDKVKFLSIFGKEKKSEIMGFYQPSEELVKSEVYSGTENYYYYVDDNNYKDNWLIKEESILEKI